MNKIKAKAEKFLNFISTDVWEEVEENHGRWKRIFIRSLKTILMAINGFVGGRIPIKASALTYYSTLSVVPIMAFLLAIAKGLGMGKLLEYYFSSQTIPQGVISKIIQFSERSLEITSKGSETIVGFGIVLFIIAIFNIFSQTEKLFNEIWQVKKGRAFIRRFTIYMCLILIIPVSIIVSSGISIYIQTTLRGLVNYPPFSDSILSPMYVFLVKLAPFVLGWIIFMLAYMLMPNTKVKFVPALVAGIFAGTAFQLFQYVYISGQIWITRYGDIYGSFAALPLFMLWMQVSWTIVLIGAQLSFSIQNIGDFNFERHINKVSFNFQQRFALLITCSIVKQFANGLPPLTSKQLSEKDRIPIRLVNEMTQSLVEAKVLSEVIMEDDTGYQPALDINKLTIRKVCEMYESRGLDHFQLTRSKDYQNLQKYLKSIKEEMDMSNFNILIKDI